VLYSTLGSLGDTAPASAPSLLIAGWAVRDIAAVSRAAEAGIAIPA
jgi:hypothetical protein